MKLSTFILPGILIKLAFVTASTASAAEGPELIVDGGFEGASFGGCPNECFTSCGFSLAPWTRGGFYTEDLFRNTGASPCNVTPVNPVGGQYFVSLQGSVCCGCNNNGSISQAVTLVPGIQYRLRMQVFIDSYDSLRVSCGSSTWTIDPTNTPTMAWTTVDWSFVADGSSTTLAIRSIGPSSAPACIGAENAYLDNVSLRQSTLSCAADINGDGRVDGNDLGNMMVAWGPAAPGKPEDLNADGAVNSADLGALLGAWGACPD